jgi:hypothetical protein
MAACPKNVDLTFVQKDREKIEKPVKLCSIILVLDEEW